MWCAVDAKSKFIYDFDVYCHKNMYTLEGCEIENLEINLEHKVVIDMTSRFHYKEHIIVVDNVFTSVVLF